MSVFNEQQQRSTISETQEDILCEAHQQQKCDFFCLDCYEFLCSGVCLQDHRNHFYQQIEVAYRMLEHQIKDIEQYLDKNLLENQYQYLTKLSQNIDQKTEQLQESLTGQFSQFQSTLDQLQLSLEEQITKQTEEILQITEKQKEDCEHILKAQDNKLSALNVLQIEPNQVFQQYQLNSFFKVDKNIVNNFSQIIKAELKLSETISDDWKRIIHFCDFNTKNVFQYDLQNQNSFMTIIPIEINMLVKSILIPEGRIFICGGKNIEQKNAVGDTYVLHQTRKEMDLVFKPLKNMLVGRINHSLAYFQKKVYAFSGKNEDLQYTQKCEVYNFVNEN